MHNPQILIELIMDNAWMIQRETGHGGELKMLPLCSQFDIFCDPRVVAGQLPGARGFSKDHLNWIGGEPFCFLYHFCLFPFSLEFQ